MMTPRAASRVFVGRYSEDAVIGVARDLREEMGTNASLGFLFVTQEWRPQIEDTLELIRLHGHVPQLVGCSGWGVIGKKREVEGEPGFSLLLLSLPAGSFTVTQIDENAALESPGPDFWHTSTGVAPSEARSWIILANPYFGGVETWLEDFSAAYPRVPVLGGLASARNAEIFLMRDGDISPAPLLAIALKQGLVVLPLVSQGCRPIGDPSPITKAEENLILEIGNFPAYQALEAAFLSIPAEQRVSVRNNLFLGLAVSEYIEDFKQGDFLIRNILGADPQIGALAVGAYPRVGQTVQFQLRDSKSAREDLILASEAVKRRMFGPIGILLFSCAGRGRGLFGTSDHDAGTLAYILGDLPLAGFFCNGEIGPVGAKTFLHGYTASAAVLCAT
ncbi:MAG TPA: FIST C-terminal domain-containing protein [Chthoniobacterales bacterium]|jgi:small ligand-binding sensory domain FIST|nr:FIST C-terminal domain-containing protein [Chthoniobacterales bacterium]